MIFVTEFIKNGGNATQAAIAAGYSEKTAYSQGSRLLKSVEVQQYLNKTEQNLNKDLRMMFAEDAVEAYGVLKEVMHDKTAPPKDRLAAARDLLDRAGYKPIEKVVADVNNEVVNHHEYHITQKIETDPEAQRLLESLYQRTAGTSV